MQNFDAQLVRAKRDMRRHALAAALAGTGRRNGGMGERCGHDEPGNNVDRSLRDECCDATTVGISRWRGMPNRPAPRLVILTRSRYGRILRRHGALQQSWICVIQLIDVVECDGLERSVVKLEAFKRAVLVQDAGAKDDLFALVMVDDRRAVLVAQGKMSLHASGGGMLKLQMFRNQLDKSSVRSRELRFCAAGTYDSQVKGSDNFDPKCFAEPSFPELVERFAAWRAGRATW
jgi:hypothetical protein